MIDLKEIREFGFKIKSNSPTHITFISENEDGEAYISKSTLNECKDINQVLNLIYDEMYTTPPDLGWSEYDDDWDF